MKKEILLITILLLTIPAIAAAEFECSDGSEVESDKKEVSTGNAKTINGLGIGLTQADEASVLKTLTAELIIDAEYVELTEADSSTEIELLKGTYTITLGNVTETTAEIGVDGTIKSIEKDEVETSSGLNIFLSEVDESAQSANFIIGDDIIALSTNINPTEKVVTDNSTFIIEIKTASDIQASIEVNKCNTGDIQEIATPTPVINDTINDTEVDDPTINNTEEEIPVNDSINDTEPETTTDTTTSDQENLQRTNEKSLLQKLNLWGVIAAIAGAIIVVILYFIMKKPKKTEPIVISS